MAQERTYQWRFAILASCLLLGAIGLVWRMVELTVIDRSFLQGQGDARTLRIIKTPAYRGIISDRNGEPLAISTPVDSIWVNPKTFKPERDQFLQLSHLLGMSPEEIGQRLRGKKDKEFVYLKRRMTPKHAKRIKALQIPGLYTQREYRRYYPEGEVVGHILGFTDVDDKGIAGMELAYNSWLQGISGRKQVLKDRLGRTVSEVANLQAPRNGNTLELSIDRRIQYLAYRELKEAVDKHHAKSGSAVVLDIKTGEVLAMVNQPSFNPNKLNASQISARRNRAVTDLFEPGSTLKTFAVLNALRSGKYKPETPVDTTPGWMMVNGKTVRDIRNYGPLDVAGVMRKSSNVGVTKLTLSLKPDSLWHQLHDVGFGELTGSDFPGEVGGVLPFKRRWHEHGLAVMSFGYGLSVTPLQLVRAYATVASGGEKKPASLLKVVKKPTAERVIKKNVADQILAMLESVVETGSGTRAKVTGYRVAGKTGTSRKVGPHGYQADHHVASFVGIAPVSNPRLAIVVVVDDPQGAYYGSLVAAPVFAEIMGGALRMLDVAPDKLNQA